MANMYLLLRDGRQSGPFTIGELLQQQLRTSDMIWIEGKSAAWCYLSEMQLTPATAEVTSDQSRIVDSSHDEDEIERKAEELRKRALAFTPQHDRERRDASSRPVIRQQPKNEEEVFHFVDHRKDKKSIAQEVFVCILIIGIFAASIYGGSSYFNNRQDVIPVAHKMEVTDAHAAIGNASLNEKPVNTLVQDSVKLEQPNLVAADSAANVVVEKSKAVLPKIARKKVRDTTLKSEPVVIKEEEVIVPPPVTNSEELINKDLAVTEKKDSTVQTEKKKKGLRGLFRKKKKADDTVNDSSE